jgi:hypothetical protein
MKKTRMKFNNEFNIKVISRVIVEHSFRSWLSTCTSNCEPFQMTTYPFIRALLNESIGNIRVKIRQQVINHILNTQIQHNCTKYGFPYANTGTLHRSQALTSKKTSGTNQPADPTKKSEKLVWETKILNKSKFRNLDFPYLKEEFFLQKVFVPLRWHNNEITRLIFVEIFHPLISQGLSLVK